MMISPSPQCPGLLSVTNHAVWGFKVLSGAAQLYPELQEAFASRDPVAHLDYNTTYLNYASKGSPPTFRKLRRKRVKKITLQTKISHFHKI